MGAIIDLWKSERGLIAVALIAAATVLAGLHVIQPEQWLDYTKVMFIAYVAGKTVSGTVALATNRPSTVDDLRQSVLAFLQSYIVGQDAHPSSPATPTAPQGAAPAADVAAGKPSDSAATHADGSTHS